MQAFDSYTLEARLSPALLVVLPVGLAVVAWFPDRFVGWGLLAGMATSFGLTALLAQIGRDPGKKKEQRLYDRWGGKPTTQLLRHSDNTLDENTKRRYHAKLAKLVPGIEIPSRRKETGNPADADAVYESAVRWLLEKTRDKKQFSLVFRENVSYGFRRNLWGMKPAGIFFCVCGLIASGAAIARNWDVMIPAAALAATALNLFLFVLWVFWIKPDWVRLAAFAYATRVLAACDNLEAGVSSSTSP